MLAVMMKRPLPVEAYTREDTYAATRLPVELATTLIPDAYTEQSYFELEREQVFARSWIPVCVADEVAAPGDYLVTEVAEGKFRQDLLFRLNAIEIRLPPLRDRREDIPILSAHFLRQHADHYRKLLMGFDEGAIKALLSHA